MNIQGGGYLSLTFHKVPTQIPHTQGYGRSLGQLPRMAHWSGVIYLPAGDRTPSGMIILDTRTPRLVGTMVSQTTPGNTCEGGGMYGMV